MKAKKRVKRETERVPAGLQSARSDDSFSQFLKAQAPG